MIRQSPAKATASIAAASGRHKIPTSAAANAAARASGDLRSAASTEISVMSSRASRRSRICSPVVPASPSMNTFAVMVRSFGSWPVMGVGGLGQFYPPHKRKARAGPPARALMRVFGAGSAVDCGHAASACGIPNSPGGTRHRGLLGTVAFISERKARRGCQDGGDREGLPRLHCRLLLRFTLRKLADFPHLSPDLRAAYPNTRLKIVSTCLV